MDKRIGKAFVRLVQVGCARLIATQHGTIGPCARHAGSATDVKRRPAVVCDMTGRSVYSAAIEPAQLDFAF